MRFLVMVKATKDSEAGVMPSLELVQAMGKFNDELAKAGVLQAADGLHPSSKGLRVRFSGGTRTIIDGPFAETRELVAGFWIWKVSSREEALDWLKRCPDPACGAGEIELRQICDIEDFCAALAPEIRRMRELVQESNKQSEEESVA